MESGGSSNPRQNHPTRTPRTGIVIHEGRTTTTTTTATATATATNPSDATNLNINQQQSFKRAADQYIPIAHVVRIMRRVLPAHAKIAEGAKETIQECVSEFINFITSEANERCHREYRKTISADDVLSAMGSLGFDNYVEPLTIFLDKNRAQDPERNDMHHHAPYARRGVHRPVAQMVQPPEQAPPPPPMDPCGNYVGLLPQMGGCFMGNQGSRDASSGVKSFL